MVDDIPCTDPVLPDLGDCFMVPLAIRCDEGITQKTQAITDSLRPKRAACSQHADGAPRQAPYFGVLDMRPRRLAMMLIIFHWVVPITAHLHFIVQPLTRAQAAGREQWVVCASLPDPPRDVK